MPASCPPTSPSWARRSKPRGLRSRDPVAEEGLRPPPSSARPRGRDDRRRGQRRAGDQGRQHRRRHGQGPTRDAAVAQIVLLDGRFSPIPGVVAEGRLVIANIERVSRLFLTKNAYAAALAVLWRRAVPYPFLPRHLTVVSRLTIGLPAFFLALSETEPLRARVPPAGPGRVGPGWRHHRGRGLRRARARPGLQLLVDQAWTAGTIVAMIVGLFVLVLVAQPLVAWKIGLIAAMGVLFVLAMAIPWLRRFFAGSTSPPPSWPRPSPSVWSPGSWSPSSGGRSAAPGPAVRGDRGDDGRRRYEVGDRSVEVGQLRANAGEGLAHGGRVDLHRGAEPATHRPARTCVPRISTSTRPSGRSARCGRRRSTPGSRPRRGSARPCPQTRAGAGRPRR